MRFKDTVRDNTKIAFWYNGKTRVQIEATSGNTVIDSPDGTTDIKCNINDLEEKLHITLDDIKDTDCWYADNDKYTKVWMGKETNKLGELLTSNEKEEQNNDNSLTETSSQQDSLDTEEQTQQFNTPDTYKLETTYGIEGNMQVSKTLVPTDLIDAHVRMQADATARAVAAILQSSTIKTKIEDIKKPKKTQSDTGTDLETLQLRPDNKERHIVFPDTYTFENISEILNIKKALLLLGVPGTGKTTAMMEIVAHILEENCTRQAILVSFNQTTDYTDIVAGLRQNEDGHWVVNQGSLARICEIASIPENKDKKYFYMIDEINRGNTEAVLGEYMTALSQRNIEVKTNAGTTIKMPDNVYIIATMNTYDASVIELNAATRSRFARIKMDANSFTAEDIKPEASEKLKKAINITLTHIKNINEALAEDTYKGERNKIGLRNMYENYTDVNGLILILKSCIEQDIRDNMDKLLQDDKDSIETELNELYCELDALNIAE